MTDTKITDAKKEYIQKPSVGRIVHFIGWDLAGSKEHRAALITEVAKNGLINLVVFSKNSILFDGSMVKNYDEKGERPGSWHWPEKV